MDIIQVSSQIKTRNVKLLFWGATGTRKTETVLRNFPKVLVIDTEGNASKCSGVKEIPEFLLAETKDVRKVQEIISNVVAGKIKFPDGKPVQTVFIDSVTVLWSVQKEVASRMAEDRARRYNKPIETATITQLDWTIAKRPLKAMYTALNNSPVPFLILSARETDKYEDDKTNNDKTRTGTTFEIMKGLDYEMNVVLHFMFENGKWAAEVQKSQGSLSSIFPMWKKMTEFPISELVKYATSLTISQGSSENESAIASSIAKEEAKVAPTQRDLLAYAKERGIGGDELAKILNDNGIKEFNPEKFQQMCFLVDQHIQSKQDIPQEG